MEKFSEKIALVYSQDNQDVALELEGSLNTVIDFHHISCSRDKNGSITSALQSFHGPIILLISDNFLTTTQCMQDGLTMLTEHKEDILLVVIPGHRIVDNGVKEQVSTDFSRFKQIVKYINFWQDRYLDLRKQKRNDPDLNTPGFTDYLHTIRDIAGSAGQYLRTLQTLSPQKWGEFTNNHFESLFEFIEEEELWESFKTTPKTEEISTPEDPTQSDKASEMTIPIPETIQDTEDNIETEPISIDQVLSEEKEIETIISAAWVLEEKGEHAVALAQLKVALERYPENNSLRYNLAVLLTQDGQFDEAWAEVDQLLQLTNEHEEVLFLAGELADIKGNTEQAIAYFQQLASVNGNYPEIYFILGKLSQKLGKTPARETETFYKIACKKNKKNSYANYQLALLYLNGLDSPKKAEKHLKKTIKIDSNHPFAHYDLATLFHKSERYEKANKYYLKSIKLEPDLQTTENDLAFSLDGKPRRNIKEEKIQSLKDKIKQLEMELEGLDM